ncbi:MAG TPA: tyrosine-type recombinase/integrase [Terrimicrobium sp.]
MPRRSVLKVVKVNYTPNAPWMVRVPARLQAMEGSQKKFFEKESVAKAYAERLARQLGEYHTQALGLTDRQKMEAAECYRLLAKEDASMLEAVQYYLKYLAQAKQSVPIRQLFEEFLAAKRQDGLSSKYLADLRSKLGRFVVAFTDTLACNLSAPMLEAWLRGLKVGSVSRESYRRNISVMLEFGRRRGALRANPAVDIKITRRPEGEVTILSLVEVARLLERCAPELVSYVAICAFAGLRPSEAEALDWADIHFDTLQIEVKARHSKTRRYRLVPMQPNLVAWLQPQRRDSGPVGYSRRKFRDAYKAAGIEQWKTDVLRHSFGTFRLPILKSADALALEMGNSPAVIFRHYRRPMTEVAAQKYFELLPSKPAQPIDVAKTQDRPTDEGILEEPSEGWSKRVPA